LTNLSRRSRIRPEISDSGEVVKVTNENEVAGNQAGAATRGPRRPFPRHTVAEALAIAETIQRANNGQPMNRLFLADALGRTSSSSDFRDLLSSSYKYGLTEGTEKATDISLTANGVAATKPTSPGERRAALIRVALTPPILRAVYERYDNKRLPEGDFFRNSLERDAKFGLPHELAEECARLTVENGRFVGIVRDISGVPHVILQADTAAEIEARPEAEEVTPELGVEAPVPPRPPLPEARAVRHIFVGHGKNTRPRDQLEKVLQEFKIPYKVATEEPNRGRPISQKVAEIMRGCHAGILIFTCDEEFRDPEGKVVWRPSENVVHELGAASILYDNRIVIFKEEGIDLPANFRDLGYISFEKDRLDAKGLDLIKELISFGLLKVTA
jgi:predicted nucleotide-binding protein